MAKDTTLNDEELLGRLSDGRGDLGELASELGASLERLAGWASGRRGAGLVRGLVRLADMQTQLVLSRHRVAAAIRLSELLSPKDENGRPRDMSVADLVKVCSALL